MEISIEELKPMGGVECVVDGVFNCPVWIEGDITTWPNDDPTFSVNEIFALLDPDSDRKDAMSMDFAGSKLEDAGFYAKIMEEIKKNGQ